jgi:hypothetical protein
MKRTLTGLSIAAMPVVGYQWGLSEGHQESGFGVIAKAIAAEHLTKVSPVKAGPRDFYAPNSEDLAPGETRLIACFTTPEQRCS